MTARSPNRLLLANGFSFFYIRFFRNRFFLYLKQFSSSSSSFMDPPEGAALRERLGHQLRAPHHGSRVEEGEHLLGYIAVVIVICRWLSSRSKEHSFFSANFVYFVNHV
jgi:hypothetical protein